MCSVFSNFPHASAAGATASWLVEMFVQEIHVAGLDWYETETLGEFARFGFHPPQFPPSSPQYPSWVCGIISADGSHVALSKARAAPHQPGIIFTSATPVLNKFQKQGMTTYNISDVDFNMIWKTLAPLKAHSFPDAAGRWPLTLPPSQASTPSP